jgi:hypothetical protein
MSSAITKDRFWLEPYVVEGIPSAPPPPSIAAANDVRPSIVVFSDNDPIGPQGGLLLDSDDDSDAAVGQPGNGVYRPLNINNNMSNNNSPHVHDREPGSATPVVFHHAPPVEDHIGQSSIAPSTPLQLPISPPLEPSSISLGMAPAELVTVASSSSSVSSQSSPLLSYDAPPTEPPPSSLPTVTISNHQFGCNNHYGCQCEQKASIAMAPPITVYRSSASATPTPFAVMADSSQLSSQSLPTLPLPLLSPTVSRASSSSSQPASPLHQNNHNPIVGVNESLPVPAPLLTSPPSMQNTAAAAATPAATPRTSTSIAMPTHQQQQQGLASMSLVRQRSQQSQSSQPSGTETIDMTHMGEAPLKRKTWWLKSLFFFIILLVGGSFAIKAGEDNDWCLPRRISSTNVEPVYEEDYDRCVCPHRETKLAAAAALMGAGAMMMMIALMFHGCHSFKKTNKTNNNNSDNNNNNNNNNNNINNNNNVNMNIVRKRDCYYWFQNWWSPPSSLLVEIDWYNMGTMMMGFLLGCIGIGLGTGTSPCNAAYVHDPDGPTRDCWCPAREALMSGGAGNIGAAIPLLLLAIHWRQDLARQHLVKATMRMIAHQRRTMLNNVTNGVYTGNVGGDGLRPCVACHHPVHFAQKFCSNCGHHSQLGQLSPGQCPSCKTMNFASSRFCLQCGSPLLALLQSHQQQLPPPMPAPLLAAPPFSQAAPSPH